MKFDTFFYIFELQLNALSKVLDRKPLLRQLYKYLSDVNFKEEYRSEFSQAFNLLKNNHIVSNYSESNGNVVHTTSQISDSGSKTTTIKEQWDNNFQDKFLNKDNTLIESVKQDLLTKEIPEIKSIYKEILEFKRKFNNLEQGVQIETFENDIFGNFKKLINIIKLFSYEKRIIRIISLSRRI